MAAEEGLVLGAGYVDFGVLQGGEVGDREGLRGGVGGEVEFGDDG